LTPTTWPPTGRGSTTTPTGPILFARAGRIHEGNAIAWGQQSSAADASIRVELRPVGATLEIHAWPVDDVAVLPPDRADDATFVQRDHVELWMGNPAVQLGIARTTSGAVDARVLSSPTAAPPVPPVRWDGDHYVITLARDAVPFSTGPYHWDAWISLVLSDTDDAAKGQETGVGLSAVRTKDRGPLALVLGFGGGVGGGDGAAALPSPGEAVPVKIGDRLVLEP